MSLKERGRAGIKTELLADAVTGLVTQDEFSPNSSREGLTGGDGTIVYAIPLTIICRFARTTSGTTTVNYFSSNAPWKFRVLRGRILCLDDAKGRAFKGDGRASIVISQGGSSVISSDNISTILPHETREISINTLGNEEVAENGSLSVELICKLPVQRETSTFEVLVELDCVRVI